MTSKLNLPNKITLIRIFLLPLLVVFLVNESKLGAFFAAIIFGIASFTDWLDGHIARVTNQVTAFGKLIDPIADKLLIMAALIPLVGLKRVPAWMAVVVLGREFAISGLRIIGISEGITIAASTCGKYKMVAEIAAIILLILNFRIIGILSLWIAMILGIVSGIEYSYDLYYKVNSGR